MVLTASEALGPKIRRQRHKLGLTLDELSGRTGISKPYLSLIETGRSANPPSDEKLRRLERSLGFEDGELVSQAHLQRTPRDVRTLLLELSGNDAAASGAMYASVAAADASVSVAGMGINRITVLPESVGWPDVKEKEAFAARVGDDAMTPKYRPEDIVIFSAILPARAGDDCFVRLGDERTLFLRVFFDANENGETVIRLQPRNESRRATVVAEEEITAMYRAIYKYQKVDEA